MSSVDAGDGPLPESAGRVAQRGRDSCSSNTLIKQALQPAIELYPQAEEVLCRHFVEVLDLPVYFGQVAPDWVRAAEKAMPWIAPGNFKQEQLRLKMKLERIQGCTPYESFLHSTYYQERDPPPPEALTAAFQVLVPCVSKLYSGLIHRHWLREGELKRACEISFSTFMTFQAALFLLGHRQCEPWLMPLVDLIGRGHHPYRVDGQGQLLVLTG